MGGVREAPRATLTFRTLSVAAIGVLLLAPQAVIHPSFQMSFAGTLALVAAYQHELPLCADTDSSLGMRVALWGAREVAGLLLASLVAGVAITAYAAFHFHRLAPYGALANLLAMPVVSALVMPHSSRDSFAIKEWLAADADARTPKDPSLANGMMCDAIGCTGKLGDGRIVSMVLGTEAFSEDCARAAVVLSAREAPSSVCAALVDRKVWQTYGAVALRWTGDRFAQTTARPSGLERPWTGTPARTALTQQGATNATPHADDFETED